MTADTIPRRSLLKATAATGATVLASAQTGCSTTSPQPPRTGPQARPSTPTSAQNSVLLAYFSRAGENYDYGGRINLEVGNTEVLAHLIASRMQCDIYRIVPEDPYPHDYDATVQRNVHEQEADARPAIANPLLAIDNYDTVLLGSGIWNIRAPMIMSTFAESLDFTGKTIHPFTTHAMSGLGTTERDYAASCPGATIGRGLAVQGEKVKDAGQAVESWLRRINLR
jgi:flavodoxin